MLRSETLPENKEFLHTVDVIGSTPLVRLDKLFPQAHINVLAKLEFLNPSGSIKDRIVLHIVQEAERTGKLRSGSTIVEGTSGNTGAAVAMISAMKGYSAILTMPDKVSREKQEAPLLFGAEVIICPSNVGPENAKHYMQRAREIASSNSDYFFLNQYENLQNIETHYLFTGPEIWADSGGKVDFFVTGASTGGTVSGVAKFLKEKNPLVEVIVPDPKGSCYYSHFMSGSIRKGDVHSYRIEGIGKEQLPGCMDFSLINRITQVTDEEAFESARLLARTEGILAGGSSGANIFACLQLAETISAPATIVTIFPDSGLKYLSNIYKCS